jgi:hypothetical protein
MSSMALHVCETCLTVLNDEGERDLTVMLREVTA